MDETKPHPDPKDYIEGEEAARRFDKVVGHALSVMPAELKRRHEVWDRTRKAEKKKSKR